MSAFLRRRMRGLLRTTFSATNSSDTVSSFGVSDEQQQQQQQSHCDEVEEALMQQMMNLNEQTGCVVGSAESAAVYERILNGRNGLHVENVPEVYSGKTGLDLPSIHLDEFVTEVKACHTGPDGGLTKVQPIRQRVIAAMAKLDDDEFSLSSLEDEEETTESPTNERRRNGKRRAKSSLSRTQTNSFEIPDFIESTTTGVQSSPASRPSLNRYDWNNWDETKAYGLSTSLYEKHPITGLSAGHPIADVFGIVSRENNAILALADGVNWGEGARLAARCAIRGAIEHLNSAIERGILNTTNDVFHCLLGSFHAAHALILQEGGALTTLCVALVAPVRESSSSVLCACNVGDSLCFVFNEEHGVREVTLASHDIGQMRDMRDAGGALGPVDGRNPQLQNLTCSMTFVRDGDLVFITSDGISDNFDPVVGKFCVIKRTRGDSSEKENIIEAAEAVFPPKPAQCHKTKSAPPANGLVPFSPLSPHKQIRSMVKRPAAILPSVGAMERHELMLLRMSDVISNGLGNHRSDISMAITTPFMSNVPHHLSVKNKLSTNTTRSTHPPTGFASSRSSTSGSSLSKSDEEQQRQCCSIDAATLCRNLIRFAFQLSAAKRRTLEDPELYRTRTHSKTEERLRRKVIRDMIMGMPGKLDHASVVAYKVGKWPRQTESPLLRRRVTEWDGGIELDGVFMERHREEKPNNENDDEAEDRITGADYPQSCRGENPCRSSDCCQPENNEGTSDSERAFIVKQPEKGYDFARKDEANTSTQRQKQTCRRRHHGRGSEARHTLGVDVSWLKWLVTSKHEKKQQQQRQKMGLNEHNVLAFGATMTEDQQQSTYKGKFQRGISSAHAVIMNGDGCSNFSLRRLRLFARHQQQFSPPIGGQQPHQSRLLEEEKRELQRSNGGQRMHNHEAYVDADADQNHRQLLKLDNELKQASSVAPQPPSVPRMGLGQLMMTDDVRQ